MAVVTGEGGRVRAPTWVGLFYRPEVRAVIYQVLTVAALAVIFYFLITNTAENLRFLIFSECIRRSTPCKYSSNFRS
jgi:ABC-type amino acid transport system permease subunit